MTKITSGPHLAALRRWIKNKTYNGETVVWMSDDVLTLPALSVIELETLAQNIANSVLHELRVALRVCSEFKADMQADSILTCENCGQHRKLHVDC